MISFKQRGNFNNLERFISNVFRPNVEFILENFGILGVDALASATPKDTGLTSESYGYKVTKTPGGYKLTWTNSNLDSSGVPIVILLEYGHGTPGGTYVQGRDFINPVMQPIFDQIAEDLWKEVTK
jgi:hypothetical protein